MDEKLKNFIEDNIPVDELREAGFFLKGTRRKDYEIIAQRVCQYFGFNNIYEYRRPEIIVQRGANVAAVKNPSEIDSNGNFIEGECGILCTTQDEFTCPICECHQEIKSNKSHRQKCDGCKRWLRVFHTMSGDISVTEINPTTEKKNPAL